MKTLRNLSLVATLLCIVGTKAFAGTATQMTMYSKTLGKQMYYWVYLPTNYTEQSKAGKKFSVVYLLHQFSFWAAGWHIPSGQPNPEVDKMIDSVNGIIAISPDDGFMGGHSWWLDSPIDTIPNKKEAQLSSFLINDLKKTVDSAYATQPARGSTGLCGVSMGGYGTLHNLRIHPEVFSVGFAVVPCVNFQNWQYGFDISYVLGKNNPAIWNNYDIFPNVASYKTNNVKIRFYTTTSDFFRADNISLDSAMTKAGVAHQFDTLSGTHEMPTSERMVTILKYFQSNFPTFVPVPSSISNSVHKNDAIRSNGSARIEMQTGISKNTTSRTVQINGRSIRSHGLITQPSVVLKKPLH